MEEPARNCQPTTACQEPKKLDCRGIPTKLLPQVEKIVGECREVRDVGVFQRDRGTRNQRKQQRRLALRLTEFQARKRQQERQKISNVRHDAENGHRVATTAL